MNAEAVSRSLSEMASSLNVMDISYFEAEATWTIMVDETLVALVRLDEARNIVTLSCDLGKPLDKPANRVLDLALLFNSQWQSTGGIRMCRTGADMDFALAQDIATSCLTLDRFAPALAALKRMADAWKKLLTDPKLGKGNPEGAMDEALDHILIRP